MRNYMVTQFSDGVMKLILKKLFNFLNPMLFNLIVIEKSKILVRMVQLLSN